ncbi:MAG: DUF6506 family protein [Treponema sp.]
MKFAFLIMGEEFNHTVDRAKIHGGSSQIIGVANMNEAIEEAKKLKQEGVNCIELCGAFHEPEVRKIIEATENTIPIGYVIHLKEQDELYNSTLHK